MAIIDPDSIIRADNYINNAEKNATPANDAGRVPKLESDGKLNKFFVDNALIDEFVTQEDITIGNPVGTSSIASKISRAIGGPATDWVNFPITDFVNVIDVISIDTNKYILLFTKYHSGYNSGQAVAFTVGNDNKLTFGTPVYVASGTGNNPGMCKLDTNKFVVVSSQDSSNNCVISTVCTVSGTTITVGSGQDLTGDVQITNAQCCQLDTNKYAFIGYTSDSTGFITGFCTVSGTTSTVVDTDTTGPNSVNYSKRLEMIKIATDKVAVISVDNGYGFVFTTASSTVVVGTSVNISGSGTDGDYRNGKVVSTADNTFWAYFKGVIAYCTVSTTTITVVDTETVTNQVQGKIFLDGTDVLEISYSTDANTSGLYKLTKPASVIVRTKYRPLVMTGILGICACDDASAGYVILSDTQYFIEGMSFNFIGIAQETKSKGETCKVKLLGKDSNQSGLLAGNWYKVNKGALEISFDLTTMDRVKALSATEIII